MCDLKSQITESQPDECCLSGLKTVTHAVTPAVPSAAPTPAPRSSLSAPVRASAPAIKLGNWRLGEPVRRNQPNRAAK